VRQVCQAADQGLNLDFVIVGAFCCVAYRTAVCDRISPIRSSALAMFSRELA
jgi:hypothetical protein